MGSRSGNMEGECTPIVMVHKGRYVALILKIVTPIWMLAATASCLTRDGRFILALPRARLGDGVVELVRHRVRFLGKSRDARMGARLERHGATGLSALSRGGPAVGFAGDVLEVLAMSRMGVLSSLTAQPSTFARPGREVLASLIIGLLLVVCGRIGTGVTARAPHPGSAGVEGGGRRPPGSSHLRRVEELRGGRDESGQAPERRVALRLGGEAHGGRHLRVPVVQEVMGVEHVARDGRGDVVRAAAVGARPEPLQDPGSEPDLGLT